MYIGSLLSPSSGLKPVINTYKRGTSVPLPSESQTCYSWKWTTIQDQGVDFVVDFGKTVYVDGIFYTLADKSFVYSASVIVDGKTVANDDKNFADEIGRSIVDGKSFERPEAEKNNHHINVGYFCDKMTIRFSGMFAPILFREFDIAGSIDDSPVVYPIPENMTCGNPLFALSDVKGIMPTRRSKDILFAAKHLASRMKESMDIKWRNVSSGLTVNLSIDKKIGKETYKVNISKDGITLTGNCRSSLLWACETFVQLVKDGNVYECAIEDKPYKELRGVHIMLPRREHIPFYERLVRSVLVPMRYNIIYLNIAGGMRFKSHPEITEAWSEMVRKSEAGLVPQLPFYQCGGADVLEHEEVAALVDFAREYGIETIPEIQSLSHVQYITIAHPEIAEVDESVKDVAMDTRSTDQPPSTFYHHSYCPSHPKSYEIIFDLIDEIVEVCRPKKYVHMGHDELYQMCLCPRCKGKDPAELLKKHITACRDKLKSKGLTMMMWADMLQPGSILYYSKGENVVDMLPKDIIMLDFVWYYRFHIDMEDRLINAGYKVMMGNLYASHYPRFESRIAKSEMLGGEISFWTGNDEYSVARLGKLYDIFMVGNMLWSSRYNSKNQYTYDRIVWDLTPDFRQRVRGVAAPSLHGRKSTPVRFEGKSEIPLELNLSLPQGNVNLGGVSFCLNGASALSSNDEIAVNAKCRSLYFLQSATERERRTCWDDLLDMGGYEIVYEDGTKEDIWVKYGGNVQVWNRRYGKPLPTQLYRHTGYVATWFADPAYVGKTPFGNDVVLYGQEWINPHPDKKISSVKLHGVEGIEGDALLHALTILR